MPKKLKGRTLWDFSTSILWGPFGGKNLKKVAQCQKKSKGGPVWYVTQETFLVQFLGPTGTIWRLRLLKIL